MAATPGPKRKMDHGFRSVLTKQPRRTSATFNQFIAAFGLSPNASARILPLLSGARAGKCLHRHPLPYYLVKSEPDVYPWSRLLSDGKTSWDGVRNFEARNNLRAMKKGDRVLFYHSGDEKAVVGIAEVTRTAYPDPTAKDGDWSAVDLAPGKPLVQPVALAEIKADAKLSGLALVKRPRLSVVPVTPAEFARVLQLGKTKP